MGERCLKGTAMVCAREVGHPGLCYERVDPIPALRDAVVEAAKAWHETGKFAALHGALLNLKAAESAARSGEGE